MNEPTSDLLALWQQQVGARLLKTTITQPRRSASMGYLTCGPPTEGLIEIQNLTLVLLYDELLTERPPVIRLTGFSASRVPRGVQWGGPTNNRLFKDLALAPRWGADRERLDLARHELLRLGLALDQLTTSRPALIAPGFVLPVLWAGFRACDAQAVENNCSELHRAVRRAGASSQRVLDQLRWKYFGLTLLPMQWVIPWHERAVAVFADLREYPKTQVFQFHRRASDLRGLRGEIPYDFYDHRFRRWPYPGPVVRRDGADSED